MQFINLTTAQGQPFDIPVASITSVESVKKGKLADNPKAASGIFYDVGNGEVPQMLATPFETIVELIKADVLQRPRITVTMTDGDRMLLPIERIVGRMGIPEGGDESGARCLLTVRLGGQAGQLRAGTIKTIETRDEIAAMTAALIIEGPPDDGKLGTNGKGIEGRASRPRSQGGGRRKAGGGGTGGAPVPA